MITVNENLVLKYIHIEGVPKILGQALRRGWGSHKDSDLHSNLWSEAVFFSFFFRHSTAKQNTRTTGHE